MREEAVGDLEGMMEQSGLAGLAQQPNEERGLLVTFSIEPMENEAKSKKEGHPIFDDAEICEIRIAGQRDTVRAVVTEQHKQRFPRQYDAFKRSQDQDAASGTPLAVWPIMKRGDVETARYLGVRTVEQLSEVTDGNMQRMGPGWHSLRQQARDWLAKAKDGALLGRLRAELEERDRRIDALEQMLKKQAAELHGAGIAPAPGPDPKVAALEAKLDALLAQQTPAPKRKYTRKPKVEVA